MKLIKLSHPPRPADPKRPRCPACDRPLRARWRTVSEQRRGPVDEWCVTQEWDGTYQGYGPFDTLACSSAFGIAAHKAGFRFRGAP